MTEVYGPIMPPDDGIRVEINGLRRPDLEITLSKMIDDWGAETVMKCLSQVLNDINGKIARRG